ncbi:MAG: hypothetical protein KME11_04855 [Timaviella obliquedivisa GSE-PSE-MK23-08B]|jgi:hypothetical protein|nr:hypothetical protein [Timaviella obliquedivisa GSE-PSE-MK23-08B]
MSYTIKQLNNFNSAQLNAIAIDLNLNLYGAKKTKAQLINLILQVQDNPELQVTLSAEAFQPNTSEPKAFQLATPQHTREQLTVREMTKPKLQAIASGLEIEFQSDCTKAQLVDWILFAQEQVEVAETPEVLEENLNEDSSEQVEVENEIECEVEVEIEDEDDVDQIELSYHERLVIYLYDRAQHDDQDAKVLLAGLGDYIQSLSAKSAKAIKPRKPSGARVNDPAAKLAIAKTCWDAVQIHGSVKLAAADLDKSPHYTKVLAQAYALYQESAIVRNAYDAGELGWTKLYNLAFRFKKSDTLESVEAQLAA